MEGTRRAPDLLPPRPRHPSVERRRSTDGLRSRVLLRTGSGAIPEGGLPGSALNVAPGPRAGRPGHLECQLRGRSALVAAACSQGHSLCFPLLGSTSPSALWCRLLRSLATECDPTVCSYRFQSRYHVTNQPGSFPSCSLRPGNSGVLIFVFLHFPARKAL